MFIVTCRCTPHPGQEEESQAAARELTAASQDHEGLIGYLWNTDKATADLHLIEVHRDEASVLNHIELSDVSRIAAATTFSDIAIYGEAPSPKMLDVMSHFGEYTIYSLV